MIEDMDRRGDAVFDEGVSIARCAARPAALHQDAAASGLATRWSRRRAVVDRGGAVT
jgi:hypothetical protein